MSCKESLESANSGLVYSAGPVPAQISFVEFCLVANPNPKHFENKHQTRFSAFERARHVRVSHFSSEA